MFRSAAVRLTVWYLALVMVLSVGTSLALYQVSSSRLQDNANRQVEFFSGLLGAENASDFAALRHKQLNEDRAQLKSNLVIFNFLVLLGGGAASYGLARRTLKPIEEALESQIRFTADASHELRTPITALQTENEVALRDAKLTKAEAVDLLKSNLVEVAKLRDLSEGLLTLAYSGNDSDISGEYMVSDIFQQAISKTAKAARLKKVIIHAPSSNQELKIKGHEHKLVELIAVLLDNSVKYSPPNSKVKLTAKKHGRYIEISVKDQGQGIKKEDLPNIFERFYRSDHARNKQSGGGYGLGLAIAKKIVEQHSGNIEVRSALGTGSEFMVRLPHA